MRGFQGIRNLNRERKSLREGSGPFARRAASVSPSRYSITR